MMRFKTTYFLISPQPKIYIPPVRRDTISCVYKALSDAAFFHGGYTLSTYSKGGYCLGVLEPSFTTPKPPPESGADVILISFVLEFTLT
jgi:hypothetical protein